MDERTMTAGGRTFQLKAPLPLSAYKAWAECAPMTLDSGLAGLNAVLETPLTAADLDDLTDEQYFGLHRAIFDFFAALRWGRSEPSAS